jgi:TRAP-type C4-dicarboxylate transport system permease small subunit
VPVTLFGDGSVFNTIINAVLYIVGIICVIMLIIGGIRYATSGGDQAQVTGAKNTIMYAVIGLVVAILAYAIVNWVLVTINSSAA